MFVLKNNSIFICFLNQFLGSIKRIGVKVNIKLADCGRIARRKKLLTLHGRGLYLKCTSFWGENRNKTD